MQKRKWTENGEDLTMVIEISELPEDMMKLKMF